MACTVYRKHHDLILYVANSTFVHYTYQHDVYATQKSPRFTFYAEDTVMYTLLGRHLDVHATERAL